jgi:hypothetical protein
MISGPGASPRWEGTVTLGLLVQALRFRHLSYVQRALITLVYGRHVDRHLGNTQRASRDT